MQYRYYGLIILYAIILTAVVVNASDIQVWGLNPAPSTTEIPLTFVYPPSASTKVNPANLYNITFNGMLSIGVALSSVGPIVEGQPVTIGGIGGISPRYASKVSSVHVGLEDALLCHTQTSCGGFIFDFNGPEFGITLQPNTNSSGFPPFPKVGNLAKFTQLGAQNETIYWAVEGDYYPVLEIHFNNGTIIDQSYPNQLVHVDPASVLVTEREGRINTALSIALVAFGFVEGIKIIEDSKKRR
jgi:hypothetical protein